MKIKDCPIGAKVRVWCIGTMKYDDIVSTILSIGTFVKVKYQYDTMEFVPDTECIICELPKK